MVASKHIVFGPKNFHTFSVAEHDWIHMTHFEGNLPHVQIISTILKHGGPAVLPREQPPLTQPLQLTHTKYLKKQRNNLPSLDKQIVQINYIEK